MIKKPAALLALFFLTTAFINPGDKAKIVKAKEFKALADTVGLSFEMPDGYTESPVKENGDLWYAFAMKNKKADFEVRYSVWSLKPEAEAYKKCQQAGNCTSVNPNSIYSGRVQANVLNMTGGQDVNVGPFPPGAVKKEFNADAGGSSFFNFNCGFGKGYKYGQMVYLHKDNVADVIITYMSNNKETHSELMEGAFHALVFK